MKKSKELNCETGLKKDLVSEEVYDRELALCNKMSKKKGGGCCWGRCETCGVVPLLHKLFKGEILEDEKLAKIRKKVFK